MLFFFAPPDNIHLIKKGRRAKAEWETKRRTNMFVFTFEKQHF